MVLGDPGSSVHFEVDCDFDIYFSVQTIVDVQMTSQNN